MWCPNKKKVTQFSVFPFVKMVSLWYNELDETFSVAGSQFPLMHIANWLFIEICMIILLLIAATYVPIFIFETAFLPREVQGFRSVSQDLQERSRTRMPTTLVWSIFGQHRYFNFMTIYYLSTIHRLASRQTYTYMIGLYLDNWLWPLHV